MRTLINVAGNFVCIYNIYRDNTSTTTASCTHNIPSTICGAHVAVAEAHHLELENALNAVGPSSESIFLHLFYCIVLVPCHRCAVVDTIKCKIVTQMHQKRFVRENAKTKQTTKKIYYKINWSRFGHTNMPTCAVCVCFARTHVPKYRSIVTIK